MPCLCSQQCATKYLWKNASGVYFVDTCLILKTNGIVGNPPPKNGIIIRLKTYGLKGSLDKGGGGYTPLHLQTVHTSKVIATILKCQTRPEGNPIVTGNAKACSAHTTPLFRRLGRAPFKHVTCLQLLVPEWGCTGGFFIHQ